MTASVDNMQASNAADSEKAQPESNVQIQSKPSNKRKLLIILAAFMLNFSGCGLLFSFGLYQSLYEDMARKEDNPFTGASSAEISLIGSIAAAMMKLGAPYVVAWCKYFSPQRVVFVGGIVYGVASVLASFGKELWHFQTYTRVLGWHWHLSVLYAIYGNSTSLVWKIPWSQHGDHLSWNWYWRSRCICTALICASGSVLSWEPKMAANFHEDNLKHSWVSGSLKVPLPPRKIVCTRKFVAQSLNAIFQSAAYYTPIFYIAAYSKTLGYSDSDGSNFTALSNACNAIGKVGVGFVADKIGRLDSFFLTTLLSSVSTAGLWIPSTLLGATNETSGKGLFIGSTVLYGLFASANIGLFSPALVELFGLEDMPRMTGIMYSLQGAAGFVGTPVAGVLVKSAGSLSSENYLYMAVFVGTLMVASTVTVLWARVEFMLERIEGQKKWLWRL
ncbi:unnamed protein product [Penicillium olsonii]|nr:unnamed protein product [Penicillium olsonii]